MTEHAKTAAEIVAKFLDAHACEVCGNAPDMNGDLQHGRGCYVVNEDGGGMSYIEFDRVFLENAISTALAAHDQQRAAELRERIESAAKEIDRQQKAKHSALTWTGDRYFWGALSADEMRDIIEAALAATAK